jgi:magnesium-transporting ATPase (P-type)
MGGGSSSSSTTVVSSQSPTDPEAARRMAAVAERQQDIAEEQWSLYQNDFLPYDKAVVAANQGLVEPTAALTGESIAAERELLPQRTATTKEFLTQALEGVNKDERVARAAADVELSYKGLPGRLSREAARLGIDPSSGAFTSQLTGIGLNLARDKAFAKTQAKTQAEQENFSRLGAAQGLNWQGTDQNQGDMTVTSPADRAVSLFQNSIAANEAGMRPLTSSTSTGSSRGSNWSWGLS